MRTANYSDLRNNLKSYIDSVIDDSETVIVNRGKGTGVVMISLDEYNAIKETEYLMSSPDDIKRIKDGEKLIHEGKGKKIDIQNLWK
ncbi:type II toxin-antitoxin system prevent-host-death family antitoxin [uncultured Parabacteroides sp.]|uniref:type II toxin-antitoxin system Phd/YefM family antitoxin n=1 Tax=uncultured Parabacteroides sp. TaxID=512312 RepID=UPI0025EE2641|nr:type II toxin-antitoxin system prevent-host-death family antitoxin [uncultured Parabacteroides sp.]